MVSKEGAGAQAARSALSNSLDGGPEMGTELHVYTLMYLPDVSENEDPKIKANSGTQWYCRVSFPVQHRLTCDTRGINCGVCVFGIFASVRRTETGSCLVEMDIRDIHFNETTAGFGTGTPNQGLACEQQRKA